MFLLTAAWHTAVAVVEAALWLFAAVARLLIRRPAVLVIVAALAFFGWLLAPILRGLADTGSTAAVYVIGGLGTLGGGFFIARALLDDRRYERGIRAREAAEAAEAHADARASAARPTVPAGDRWWEEGR
jgi:hypothetical protein